MTLLIILLTIGSYIAGIYIYRWKPYPFTIPIVTATCVIILALYLFDISYDSYMIGAEWIDQLLGPAVVALAYPLYRHRNLIGRYTLPLLTSIVTGMFISVFTGFLLVKWIGVPEKILITFLPKSVTTPVAMEITRVSGGTPSVTIVFVMVAGIGGVIVAPYVFKWFNIEGEMARGVSLGSASHAIGTSKALEYGGQAGAISSVAMTITALMASIFIPIVASYFI